ncbi:MAG: patatin-like phospholipase family protein [Pseudomonadales bacterium]|nr:patatin-like phospholipase family protein [Pseudomonadales bacterium]
MSAPALDLFAGPTALRRLQREGLRADSFGTVVGASGGPKWFVLYGLDRYLFGDFFAGREKPLVALGSSAGAWRLSCLGLQDPVAGIDRLAKHYAAQQYSADPDIDEVSQEAVKLVDIVLGEHGAREIAEHPVVQVNIIADRVRGLVASERRGALMAGLGLSAVANLFSRRTLGRWFQRVVFHAGPPAPALAALKDFDTRCVRLTEGNVRKALLASGAIPLVLKGVADIPGAPPGLYRDGGITDYHFDLPFQQGEDLVLYPHFYSHFSPGWFDKSLPWRRPRATHYHNVLVLAPSREFVRSLPHGKIPDRKDFVRMDFDARHAYWQTVLQESARLGEEFAQLVRSGEGLERIRPLDEAVRKP